MLGYVKCETGELLVKHHQLYQACYCGLCHSIKKNATRFLLPFFSYDFVFLATLRLLATGEEMKVEKQNCFFHPFSKKKRLSDCEALRFSAGAALLMTWEKMRDDLADEDVSFFRTLLLKLYCPILGFAVKKECRRDPEFRVLAEELSRLLEEGRQLEKKGADLDAMCSNFSDALSLLFSHGLEENPKKFLSAIGGYLGRVIYTVDALEDWEENAENGSFNPLLSLGNSRKEAGKELEKLDLVLSFYIKEMKLVLDLMDRNKDLFAICENIICRGLPQAIRNALIPNLGEKQ